MAKKKVDGEKVFQDMLALLGNTKSVLFIGGCRLLLESEVWLIQQSQDRQKALEGQLKKRFKTATDDEQPIAIMAMDRLAKVLRC